MHIDATYAVLHALIKYCYIDTLPDASSETDDVLDFDWASLHAMGDKYDIQPLAHDVEQSMLRKLLPTTATKILRIATAIKNNDSLYQKVSAFIHQRFSLIAKRLYGESNETLSLMQDVISSSTSLSFTTTAPYILYHAPIFAYFSLDSLLPMLYSLRTLYLSPTTTGQIDYY